MIVLIDNKHVLHNTREHIKYSLNCNVSHDDNKKCGSDISSASFRYKTTVSNIAGKSKCDNQDRSLNTNKLTPPRLWWDHSHWLEGPQFTAAGTAQPFYSSSVSCGTSLLNWLFAPVTGLFISNSIFKLHRATKLWAIWIRSRLARPDWNQTAHINNMSSSLTHWFSFT